VAQSSGGVAIRYALPVLCAMPVLSQRNTAIPVIMLNTCRSEETLLSSMDAYGVCLDDMETWLTESESVVEQRVNLSDVQQINSLLTAVKVIIYYR